MNTELSLGFREDGKLSSWATVSFTERTLPVLWMVSWCHGTLGSHTPTARQARTRPLHVRLAHAHSTLGSHTPTSRQARTRTLHVRLAHAHCTLGSHTATALDLRFSRWWQWELPSGMWRHASSETSVRFYNSLQRQNPDVSTSNCCNVFSNGHTQFLCSPIKWHKCNDNIKSRGPAQQHPLFSLSRRDGRGSTPR